MAATVEQEQAAGAVGQLGVALVPGQDVLAQVPRLEQGGGLEAHVVPQPDREHAVHLAKDVKGLVNDLPDPIHDGLHEAGLVVKQQHHALQSQQVA